MFGITRKTFNLAICAMTLQLTPAFAESLASSAAPAIPPEVSSLEQKYFGHNYDKDTPDKRVQRLELMLFGATQDGEMDERIARVNKYANEHVNAPKTAQNQGADSDSISVLERKILKKTFDTETPAQRLARLESKVFGNASPAMSVGDRVFRLKKMLNVETPSISRLPQDNDMDTMPPFSGGGITVVPFGINGGGLNGGGINGFGGKLPGGNGLGGNSFGGNNFGGNSFGGNSFGGINGFGGLQPDEANDLAQQMNEMMNQLNRSLRSIQKMPRAQNQNPTLPPDVTPFMDGMIPHFYGGQPLSPRMPLQKKKDSELPPYLDPNSI